MPGSRRSTDDIPRTESSRGLTERTGLGILLLVLVGSPVDAATSRHDFEEGVYNRTFVDAASADDKMLFPGVFDTYGPLAVAFLLDSSGSMRQNDPGGLRVSAFEMALAALPTGSSVSVVDFDDRATLLVGWTRLGADRSTLVSLVRNVNSDGGTHLGNAVRAGFELLSAAPVGFQPVGILLTDGKGAYFGEEADLVRRGIPLYTIGLGSDLNIDLLEGIAANTGGQYIKATNASDLGQRLSQLVSEMAGRSAIAIDSGMLRQGELHETRFLVDGLTSSLSISLSWPGSTMTLEFRDPTGRPVSPDRTRGSTFEVATIDNPIAGEWVVTTIAVAAEHGPEPFRLFVSGEGPLRLASRGFPGFVDPGGVLTFRLALDASFIDPQTVFAVATLSDSREGSIPVPTRVIPGDDGLVYISGDVRVGPVVGDLDLMVVVSGVSSSGSRFQRLFERTFSVVLDPLQRPFAVRAVTGAYVEFEGAFRAGLFPGLRVIFWHPESGQLLADGRITSVIDNVAFVEVGAVFGVDPVSLESVVGIDDIAWFGDRAP